MAGRVITGIPSNRAPPYHAPFPSFDQVFAALANDPVVVRAFQDHWNDRFIPNEL